MYNFFKSEPETIDRDESEEDITADFFADDIHPLNTLRRLNACKIDSQSEECLHFYDDDPSFSA